MLPLLKAGSAAAALGNALVPSAPAPAARGAQRQVMGIDVLSASVRTREEADVFAWQAEQSWFGAPALGRLAGGALALACSLWWTRRK